MKRHDKLDLIIADDGLLLTQSKEVMPEDRVFSSRVYDSDTSNWVECSLEYAEQIIAQRNELEQESNENTEEIIYE